MAAFLLPHGGHSPDPWSHTNHLVSTRVCSEWVAKMSCFALNKSVFASWKTYFWNFGKFKAKNRQDNSGIPLLWTFFFREDDFFQDFLKISVEIGYLDLVFADRLANRIDHWYKYWKLLIYNLSFFYCNTTHPPQMYINVFIYVVTLITMWPYLSCGPFSPFLFI